MLSSPTGDTIIAHPRLPLIIRAVPPPDHGNEAVPACAWALRPFLSHSSLARPGPANTPVLSSPVQTCPQVIITRVLVPSFSRERWRHVIRLTLTRPWSVVGNACGSSVFEWNEFFSRKMKDLILTFLKVLAKHLWRSSSKTWPIPSRPSFRNF